MAAARFPLPNRNGDTTVCFHRLRGLSAQHRLTLACLVETPPSAEDLAAVSRYCQVKIVKKSRPRRLADTAILGGLMGEPLQLAYFHSRLLKKMIEAIHREHPFDLAHAFLLRARPIVASLGLPILLDVNDSQTLAVGHRRAHAHGLKTLALTVEEGRVSRLERSVGGPRERVVVLSERDRDCFRPGVAEVIPMGIDIPTSTGGRSAEPMAVFSGNIGYYPNTAAILSFVRECWSTVRAAVPDARLRIVGLAPPDEVRELHGRDGVEVLGEVPKMSAAISPAWVSIAPMTVSWGMHTKVLEAMASGVPVVATPACGGAFADAAGRGLTIAEFGPAFAEAVARSLKDRAQAQRLGQAARAFVTERYAWESADRRIDDLYKQLLAA